MEVDLAKQLRGSLKVKELGLHTHFFDKIESTQDCALSMAQNDSHIWYCNNRRGTIRRERENGKEMDFSQRRFMDVNHIATEICIKKDLPHSVHRCISSGR